MLGVVVFFWIGWLKQFCSKLQPRTLPWNLKILEKEKYLQTIDFWVLEVVVVDPRGVVVDPRGVVVEHPIYKPLNFRGVSVG